METETKRIDKELAHFGVPWEKAYGYAQAVRVKDRIYLSGQLSHDEEGNLIAPGSFATSGVEANRSIMETQMRTTYANAAKILARFGAGLEQVVEEVVYVTDMEAAFAVAGTVRKAAYGSDHPQCASTIVEVRRLALPQQLIEISFTAVLPD